MTLERIEADVPEALDGERVDRAIATVFGCSRRVASDAVAEGRAIIDGQVVTKPSERVVAGTRLVATIDRVEQGLVPAPEMSPTIVHVDPLFLIVDKAPGVVVHPGAGTTEPTLVEGLLAHYPELEAVGPVERPGIVHRLDRGTSGLLVVARTTQARQDLTDQLADRTMGRRYRAVCGGSVGGSSGVIDAPLGRDPRDPTRRAVVADGRPARTHFEVTARHPEGLFTELVCHLETGRTHQIRVHLASIDHVVAGDERYGATRGELGLTRPFLHAEHLQFDHPGTGEVVAFDSPLAADLVAARNRVEWVSP